MYNSNFLSSLFSKNIENTIKFNNNIQNLKYFNKNYKLPLNSLNNKIYIELIEKIVINSIISVKYSEIDLFLILKLTLNIFDLNEIKILTYYNKDKSILHDLAQNIIYKDTDTTIEDLNLVETIDKFQGSESSIIFLYLPLQNNTNSNKNNILNSRNRLNVALTRNKYKIIIYGEFAGELFEELYSNIQ